MTTNFYLTDPPVYVSSHQNMTDEQVVVLDASICDAAKAFAQVVKGDKLLKPFTKMHANSMEMRERAIQGDALRNLLNRMCHELNLLPAWHKDLSLMRGFLDATAYLLFPEWYLVHLRRMRCECNEWREPRQVSRGFRSGKEVWFCDYCIPS